MPVERYVKVRFRGIAKNTAQLVTLFTLSNLWMARRYLLASAGEVRPQCGEIPKQSAQTGQSLGQIAQLPAQPVVF